VKDENSTSRRSFLGQAAASALALGIPAQLLGCTKADGKIDAGSADSSASAAGTEKLDRIGLQLYTVRDMMKANVEDTLAKVAGVGYKEVEFAGYFGRKPNEIRALLAKNGLTAPSSHVSYPEDWNAWRQTVSDAKTAGHRYVTVAWTPDEKRNRPGGFKAVADDFNKAGEEAKKAGLRFAYHNHDYELKKSADGTLPFEVLLQNTDPKLVTYEMDLYWMVKGGADPIDYFKRFPGRFTMVHVKDATAAPERKMADVGSGTIDFPKIFANAAKSGMRYFFVEHDSAAQWGGGDAFKSVAASIQYLSSLK